MHATTSLPLADYLETYALEAGLERASHQQYRYAVNSLEHWAGKSLTLDDLSDDLINHHLAWYQEGRKPSSVASRKRRLLSVWRAAFQSRLVDVQPQRVRKVKCPTLPPEAWTRDQCLRLLRVAAGMEGWHPKTGIANSAWWRAFIFLAWDTALRLGDILAIERDWIDEAGLLVITQAKTGNWESWQLSPATVEAVNAISSPDRLALPWTGNRSSFYAAFRTLVLSAGLKGTSRWLRRSSATAVALDHGVDAASRHLGHRSPGLAARHYLDPRILRQERPLPPTLAG